MKATLASLCVALSAFVTVARADDNPALSNPAPSADTSARAKLKTAWPASRAVTHRTSASGVPNFGKLNDFIWRSGQPSREGYQALAGQGLKTVVNLREEYPQDKDLLPQGVRYVYIPIKDEHAPTDEQANLFLETASNPDNWPLLVHCQGGQGRAGVMSALIRHSFDGWNHDMLMKEVGNYRSKHLGFISVPMAGSQQKFIQQWEASADQSQDKWMIGS